MFHGKNFFDRETFFIFVPLTKTKRQMEVDTLNILTNVFSGLAFPTAVCVALFWVVFKQNKEIQKSIDENTKVLTELNAIIKTFIK